MLQFFKLSGIIKIDRRTPPPQTLELQNNTLKGNGTTMQISARNIIKGKVKVLKPGAVNSEVDIELPSGDVIVSIITNTSAERLELKVGKEVYAVIKASDVIVGID